MSTSDPPVPLGKKLKLAGIGGLIGLLLGLGFAGKVWMDGRGELDALRAENEVSLAEAGAASDAIQSERDTCQGQIEDINQDLALMVSRIEIARSVVDLDEQNLGLANRHLSEADRVLSRADPARVGALRERIGDTRVTVGADLDQQRSELNALGAALDALLSE